VIAPDDISNLAVIYFACAAPFVVHFSFRAIEGFGFADFVRCAAAGIFWPVVALLLLWRRSRAPREDALRTVAEAYRLRLEAAAELTGRTDEAFEFRDTVLRYVGLQLARLDATSSPAEENLAAAVQHPSPALARACFARRSKRLIDEHSRLAAEELAELVARMDNRQLAETAAAVRLELEPRETQASPTARSSRTRVAAAA
jgi:hypothetical protein